MKNYSPDRENYYVQEIEGLFGMLILAKKER